MTASISDLEDPIRQLRCIQHALVLLAAGMRELDQSADNADAVDLMADSLDDAFGKIADVFYALAAKPTDKPEGERMVPRDCG